MAQITAADVKKLREMTDAPMMACKKALEDADGDLQKAADLVRERTGAKMDARAAERTASEGTVVSYLHVPTPGAPPKVGVMVQLHCETDFVAKNDKFQQLGRDIALHIAAMKPLVVSEGQIDETLLEREREFARKEAAESGKPAEIVERIVEGKIKKFYEESVLLNQKWVRDDSKTINDLVTEVQGVLGEKVEVARFVRFEVGAGS
jgi:elongation factor Ts